MQTQTRSIFLRLILILLLFKTDPPKSTQTPEPAPISTTPVVETKPITEVTPQKSEIKPTKPVVKTTKPLSSVVRVVSANLAPSSSANDNSTPKPGTSKVQIVSSHVEPIDESKKSVIQNAAIAPSRVEVVGVVSSPESYVEKNRQFTS